MKLKTLQSDILLLCSAVIWGFAFVAQRKGMEYVGPFAFNAVRFFLGGIVLIPVLYVRRNKKSVKQKSDIRLLIFGGSLAGTAIFMGATLQQIGIIYTSAGKAGFITGLYVIIVPVISLVWRQRVGIGTWLGAVSAICGLYLLSITEDISTSTGDLLVLIGAFFWACHVHIVGWFSSRIDPVRLAFFQFIVCSVLSLAGAVIFSEEIILDGFCKAIIPILYAGLMSVGIAFTLQVVAQRASPPSHSAIILSLEAVFAVMGGYFLLGETLTMKGISGCILMLLGMFLSQIYIKKRSV